MFTQTKDYLSWHDRVGTKTFYKDFILGGKVVAQLAALIIDLRVGKVLYIPYGPLVYDSRISYEIISYLKALAQNENCVFVRFEDENNFFKNEKNIFLPPIKSFSKEGIFQPRVEWWLDIQGSEDEIYEKFHKDHRYSIRRAQKEDIQIEIIGENLDSYFDIFYKLLKETGERDGFHLYSKEYYKEIFSQQGNQLKKFLVFTKKDEEYLSTALVVVRKDIANLVFAGSVSQKRELGFNHLMQWEAIKKAKNIGCKYYNFGGITNGKYGKKSLQGVTNFKKRFGGFEKFHGDFVDIPVRRLKYFLYLFYKIFSSL